jgi:hypothetical protein
MTKYPSEYRTNGPLQHLYLVWRAMLRRCSPGDREDQKAYYDKGVRVCEEWKEWPVFAKWAVEQGYERGLQIDRRENSKGYEPSNCRFCTPTEQHHNRDLLNTYRHIKEGQTLRWAKEFECVDTGQRYLTQIEAQREHGVDRKTLRMCLAGKYTKAGGKRWRYVED